MTTDLYTQFGAAKPLERPILKKGQGKFDKRKQLNQNVFLCVCF